MISEVANLPVWYELRVGVTRASAGFVSQLLLKGTILRCFLLCNMVPVHHMYVMCVNIVRFILDTHARAIDVSFGVVIYCASRHERRFKLFCTAAIVLHDPPLFSR